MPTRRAHATAGQPAGMRCRAPRAIGTTLAALLLASVSHTALAGERHALLIGNSAYESLPELDNPALDADLLGRTLEALGFTVQVVTDASYDGMRAAIDVFRQQARGAEVALVYYAGHGVQVDGVNYLLPVTARIAGRDDLRREALVLAFLLHELETAAPEFGILVLDACRDNPVAELEAALAQQTGRSLAPREGLAPTVSATGLLVAYSTAPGQVALDGPPGGNSPFAEALAHYLDEPGLEIGLLFRKVSARVRQATAGAQVPWTEASLTERTLVLNPAPSRPEQEDAIAALNRAIDIDDPLEQRLALARFTREHEGSPFAQLAAAYLARLEPAQPQPGIQLASFEQTVADRQRVELMAGSEAEPLAEALFATLHPVPAPEAPEPPAVEPPAVEPVTAPAPEPETPETVTAASPPPSDAAALLWPLVAAADRPDYYAHFLALFPTDSRAASASAGLELAAFAAAPSTPPPAPSGERAETLRVPVVVGTGPVTIPLPEQARALVLREAPRHGRLRAIADDGAELALSQGPVTPDRLEYLPPSALRQGVDAALLEWGPAKTPEDLVAEADAGTAPDRDVAALAGQAGPVLRSAGQGPERAGEAGEPLLIQLEITVDECDQLAGARFDRQGVVLGNFPTEIDTAAAIAACERALDTYPDVPRFAFQLGRALEEAGLHARAAALYAEAGEAGHVLATTRLGYLHLIGQGVPHDIREALALFEEAAASGEPYAMNSLARLYATGEGVEADREQAIDWYLQAAARGHTFAYNNLGYMLAEAGEADRALPLFQASAEAGDVYGYNNMGYAYQNGIGVEPDMAQAIAWYERAAQGGQPNAPINLGFIYRDGAPGIAPDPQRAAFWFAEAANGGNPWGSIHLAALHAQGALEETPEPVLAAKLLARVAWIDQAEGRHAAQQNYGGAGNAARERFAQLPTRIVVQAVQSELAAQGFDPGPVDGLPGRRTEAAITAFLEARGLDPAQEQAPIDLLAELLRTPDLE